MKSLFAAAVLLVASAAPGWAQMTAQSLVGTWAYTGTSPDGSTYDGTITVKPDASGGVEIRYDDGTLGIGLVQGNALAVAAVVESKNTVMIMAPEGPIMKGTWVRRTEAGMGTEIWKKK